MGSQPSRTSHRSPRQLSALLGVLFTFSCGVSLVHTHPKADPGRLSAEEEAVQVYFKEQKLPCENYINLGHIQAASGEELEEGEKQEDRATFEHALAWLKKEALKRGASGVIIYDRKGNKAETAYFVTGIAIRCVVDPATNQ
jgi:hypothetical protein